MEHTHKMGTKDSFVMTKQQHDVLIGTLLGDGSLASNQKGLTWSYRCLHGIDQKAYLDHNLRFLLIGV